VTDYSGNQASDNITVTVLDVTKPTAYAGEDRTVAENQRLTFDGTMSYDNVGVSNYTWTFTDDGLKILKGISPAYVFESPGVYQVTLIVTDYSGNQASDNITVTVLDVTKPTAYAGEDIIMVIDNVIVFNGIDSTDNTGIVSYTWDFGDGTFSTGAQIEHEYANTGTYDVSLTVEDTQGNQHVDWIKVTIQPASSSFFLLIIGLGFVFTVIIVVYREKLRTWRDPKTKPLDIIG
jgi:hypothetical protein